jgi:hypothetical protein
MLHTYPGAEEPRRRPPGRLWDAPGAPQAATAPLLAAGPLRPPGAPWRPPRPPALPAPEGDGTSDAIEQAERPRSPTRHDPTPRRITGLAYGVVPGADSNWEPLAPGGGAMNSIPSSPPSSTPPLPGSAGSIRYTSPGEHPGTSPPDQDLVENISEPGHRFEEEQWLPRPPHREDVRRLPLSSAPANGYPGAPSDTRREGSLFS